MTTQRSLIGLEASKCTSCMLCVRECPVWCISLSAHSEADPQSPTGGRQRMVNVLDEFTIDFGVCMYCGICVDVCPFDALAWHGADAGQNLAVAGRQELVHDKEVLGLAVVDELGGEV